jgi:hypothetical protein
MVDHNLIGSTHSHAAVAHSRVPSRRWRLGHADKTEGCSTNQPLSATPASQDQQCVLEVNSFLQDPPLQLMSAGEQLGPQTLGVEQYISSTMPTLLERGLLVLIPLRLPSLKLPRHSIHHV